MDIPPDETGTTMAIWARAVRLGRSGVEPLLVLAGIVGLRRFGLAGAAPLWIIALVQLAGAIAQQPAMRRRLAGGDDRSWPPVGLHVLLAAATMYLTGWGPVLAVALLPIVAAQVRRSGARAWRPAAAASVLGLALGQIGYATGALFSYLPVARTHGLALLIGLGVVITTRAFGQAVAGREAAERALRHSEQWSRALVRDGSDMIVAAGADGTVTYVSPAVLPVLGYAPDELIGTSMTDLTHPDDRDLPRRSPAGDTSAVYTIEVRVRHADGRWRWHEVTVRNLLAQPEVGALLSHHRDITESKLARDRTARDVLTGLASAAMVGRDLERALAQGTRYQHPVGLLMLELAGVTAVTDTYGQEAGDALLRTVGAAIRRTVRAVDTVGRLGGDEFAVVLTRVNGADQALGVAGRIVRGIRAGSVVAGVTMEVGCTVGVALAYPGGTDAKTLLRHADTALRRAKQRGPGGVRLYVEEDVTAPWSS